MRLRDMQKRTLKRPEFVESAPKYRQRTEITVFMRSLIYQGFQNFSAPLRVTVTGRSGDGDIDGIGVLRVNRLVSFKVLFQCKRYRGSVDLFKNKKIGQVEASIVEN
jgi:restriction system protein